MEEWDLYDENRKQLNKSVVRGEKLADNEYHLVVNAWVINSKKQFLISQRAPTKTYPYRWECTGGSVLKGENSLKGAMRELKEELGIQVDADSAILVGTTNRYYVGCPDILDVWLFRADVSLEELTLQKEEVCNVKWASAEEIEKLIQEDKFEANAFWKEVLEYGKEI